MLWNITMGTQWYTEFIYFWRGTVTTILLLSRQNCGEIMTQNLFSKQEKLLQPQEEDIKRFSKGEQTSVFFSGGNSHSQWKNLYM